MCVVFTMRNPLCWRPPLFFIAPQRSPPQTSWRRKKTQPLLSHPCIRTLGAFITMQIITAQTYKWIFIFSTPLDLFTNFPEQSGAYWSWAGNSSSVWPPWKGKQQSVFWHLNHRSRHAYANRVTSKNWPVMAPVMQNKRHCLSSTFHAVLITGKYEFILSCRKWKQTVVAFCCNYIRTTKEAEVKVEIKSFILDKSTCKEQLRSTKRTLQTQKMCRSVDLVAFSSDFCW